MNWFWGGKKDNNVNKEKENPPPPQDSQPQPLQQSNGPKKTGGQVESNSFFSGLDVKTVGTPRREGDGGPSYIPPGY